MVKYPCILLCLLVLTSCAHHERALTMKDIQWPDPEKEAIIRNRISEINGYDTAEVFANYPDGRQKYGKRLLFGMEDSRAAPYLGSSIETIKYDRKGNKIYYFMNPYWQGNLLCGVGLRPDYEYDSMGFMTAWGKKHYETDANGKLHTDAFDKDSFSYVLWQREKILLEIRYQREARFDFEADSFNRYFVIDTSAYLRDDMGRPTLYIFDLELPVVRYGSRVYKYDHDGNISYIREYYPRDKTLELGVKGINYFYTGGRLDSSIEYYKISKYYEYYDKVTDHTNRRYYNKDGLIASSLLNDTLHVYYTYERF